MFFSNIKRLLGIQFRYFVNCFKYGNSRVKDDSVTGIIFSRDRAMQLEALLLSIQRFSQSTFPIIVQYSCSDRHRQSYLKLIKLFPSVTFVEEDTVNATLKRILLGLTDRYMFYLVDDQVFIRPFDVQEAIPFVNRRHFFSMRLGETILNWGIRDVPIHAKYVKENSFNHWTYKENSNVFDYRYKFSVDGHIYRTIDVLRCTMSIPFRAPNSYEANMNSVILFKTAEGCSSFEKPVVVNLIINASRQETGYEQCEAGEYTADDLLYLYEQGRRFDIERISAIQFNSAHSVVKSINTILK